MRVVPLPPTPELEKLLAGLLARTVKVTAAEAPPGGPCAVALYRSDAPVVEVAALVGLPLAASFGAALSVVPPGVVRDVVAAGALDGALQDNLGEVMNVLARFVSASGRRFALAKLFCPPAGAPPDLGAAARGSDEIRAVAVDVAGYASGQLAFCTI